jgi:hypothetical protein
MRLRILMIGILVMLGLPSLVLAKDECPFRAIKGQFYRTISSSDGLNILADKAVSEDHITYIKNLAKALLGKDQSSVRLTINAAPEKYQTGHHQAVNALRFSNASLIMFPDQDQQIAMIEQARAKYQNNFRQCAFRYLPAKYVPTMHNTFPMRAFSKPPKPGDPKAKALIDHDRTFETVFRLVYEYGFLPGYYIVRPTVTELLKNAIKHQFYGLPDVPAGTMPTPAMEQMAATDYLVAAVKTYYGFSTPHQLTEGSHEAAYLPASREQIAQMDPSMFELIHSLWPDGVP